MLNVYAFTTSIHLTDHTMTLSCMKHIIQISNLPKLFFLIFLFYNILFLNVFRFCWVLFMVIIYKRMLILSVALNIRNSLLIGKCQDFSLVLYLLVSNKFLVTLCMFKAFLLFYQKHPCSFSKLLVSRI